MCHTKERRPGYTISPTLYPSFRESRIAVASAGVFRSQIPAISPHPLGPAGFRGAIDGVDNLQNVQGLSRGNRMRFMA